MCTVRALCVVKGFSMAAILPFAFEVGCEGFFGQVQMHVCVHLHTRGCTRVHSGTGTGAGMNVHRVFLTCFSMAAILPFAFQLYFNLIDQISILDFL